VTDLPAHQQSFGAGLERQADGPFLRRILIGLIAATVLSGAVSFALTAQHELVEGLLVASTHGPA
jgi:hypothetical protein